MAGLTVQPYVTSGNLGNVENYIRQLADTVRQLTEGKSNAVGTFTLTPSATSTTVTAVSCTPASVVLFDALTQDAANDKATTSIVSGNGQFVVTHADNARTDRTFGYEVRG